MQRDPWTPLMLSAVSAIAGFETYALTTKRCPTFTRWAQHHTWRRRAIALPAFMGLAGMLAYHLWLDE